MSLQLPARYRHLRPLGRGGMGEVHLVFDAERGAEVALKAFAPPQDLPAARSAFRQEFGAMATLAHPNLVAAYDYGELPDGRPFFTMEVVAGRDLGEALPQSEAELKAWLPQVAAALALLHARGFVHGDLNPGNVRLLEDGTAKLMDLGLLERSGRAGGPVKGTLAYLAPEVARSGAVDGRADLYALGAVAFQALSGRPPFLSEDPISLLKAHLHEAPPALGPLAVGLSKPMEAAVMRLLAKAPEDRFPTAGALLEALGLTAELPESKGLLAAPLLGREEAMGAVSLLWDPQGPSALWVHGPVGVGKSRLLAEARAGAQLAGRPTYVLAGLGPDAAPYAAWRPVLQALCSAAPAALRDRLAPVLVKLLPELGVAPAEALEGSQERTRLQQAVGELAATLAPNAAWLVDDRDRLDDASAALLATLRARPDMPWRWLLAAETEPAAGDDTPTWPLSALDLPEAEALAAALLGQSQAPALAMEALATLAGGLPGAVEAVLGHWLRSGALVRANGRWEAALDADFGLPGGWQAAQDAQVEGLGDAAKALAMGAALVGPSGPLDAALAAAQLAPSALFAALAEAEQAEVLQGEAGAYRFTRPALATALASRWAPEALPAAHGRIAAAFVAMAGGRPDAPQGSLGDRLAAARHLLASAQPLASGPWAVAAVRQGLALYALSGLEPVLDAALALEGLPEAETKGLKAGRATMLRFQARLDEALEAYEALLDPADPELAQHLTSLAVVLQMRDRYPEALTRLGEAIQVADAAGLVKAGVRARAFVGRVATFAGQPGVARTHLRSAIRRAREAGLLSLLAAPLTLYGYLLATKQSTAEAMAEGVACLEEAIRLNEEEGNDYELQDAWTMLGNVNLHAGRLAEARDAIHKGLSICKRLNMANETLFGHLNLGACLLELGDLPAALEHATRAVELARRQGRKFPEGFAVALEGSVRLKQGEPAGGLERLMAGLAIAKEIGNKYLELNVAPMVLDALVYLGRFAEAEAMLRSARALALATKNDEQAPKLNRLELALMVLSYEGRAGMHAEGLLKASREAGQAAPLAQLLRWEAERLERAGQADQALERVREARALAEEATLGLLTAELALHEGRLLLSQDPGEAAIAFAIALDLGDSLGSPVIGAIARAGLSAADPSMRALRAEARSRMDAVTAGLSPAELQDFLSWPARDLAFAAPAPTAGGFSLDRVRHLTELIAAISASASLDAVLAQALGALVDLAGCDRGFLLMYEGFEVTHRVLHGLKGEDAEAYSATLAYQVLWSGHPIVLEDAQADAEFGVASSVQNLELRFAVGVPIRDGHEALGVMLADSKGLNPGFGADDLVVAEALGKQVAVAIRQARELERYRNGFTELEALHRLALNTIGEPEPIKVMGEVVREALALTQADRALVLWGPDLRCLAQFDHQAEPLGGQPQEVSQSVARWVLERLEPLHLMDAQADEAFQSAKSVAALGLRTIYAVPLKQGGQGLGVLYLDLTRLGEPGPGVMHTLERLGEFLGAYLAKAGPALVSKPS